MTKFYSVFQRFRQTKSAYGGLILGLSQFSQLTQLPQKTELALKAVNSDSKIIILRHESKFTVVNFF
jgi:hypothetical protein